MPLPYQYRDYPLGVFLALVMLVGGVWTLCAAGSHRVEVTFTSGCCEEPSCTAVTALQSLSFAKDVRHDVRGGLHSVSLNADGDISPQKIWDVLVLVDRRPSLLRVDRREYSVRPEL